MSIARAIKRRLNVALPPMIFLAITGYFAWNATQGDRGLVAFAQRKLLQQQVLDEKAAAQAERDAWEVRVRGLRPQHLNPDTLDERARSMLNLAEPDEVIVKLSSQEKLF
jgi:cell division protein FtsB